MARLLVAKAVEALKGIRAKASSPAIKFFESFAKDKPEERKQTLRFDCDLTLESPVKVGNLNYFYEIASPSESDGRGAKAVYIDGKDANGKNCKIPLTDNDGNQMFAVLQVFSRVKTAKANAPANVVVMPSEPDQANQGNSESGESGE